MPETYHCDVARISAVADYIGIARYRNMIDL